MRSEPAVLRSSGVIASGSSLRGWVQSRPMVPHPVPGPWWTGCRRYDRIGGHFSWVERRGISIRRNSFLGWLATSPKGSPRSTGGGAPPGSGLDS